MTMLGDKTISVPANVPCFEVINADGMGVAFGVWCTKQVHERPTDKGEVKWDFEYKGVQTLAALVGKLGWQNFAQAVRGGVVAAKYGNTGSRLWYFIERLKNKKKPERQDVTVQVDFS